jgi:hypothetical protein
MHVKPFLTIEDMKKIPKITYLYNPIEEIRKNILKKEL